MKKFVSGVMVLMLGACVWAQLEPGKVTVTGDRVSLRAAPKLGAVLLDRMMSGDELILQNNENPDWVGVVPPDSVDLWVHREYVENGKVVPPKLNVRSGPSLNHSVVGVLKKDEELTVRGEVGEWARIAPTAETTAWISRKYVEVAIPEPPKPVEPVEAEIVVAETETPVEVISEPTVEDVMRTAGGTSEIPEMLTRDPSREQGIVESFAGILKPTDSILYKLVDSSVEEITVCYVIGNQAQMEAYTGFPMKLTGPSYWADGMDMPIVRPAKIEIISE